MRSFALLAAVLMIPMLGSASAYHCEGTQVIEARHGSTIYYVAIESDDSVWLYEETNGYYQARSDGVYVGDISMGDLQRGSQSDIVPSSDVNTWDPCHDPPYNVGPDQDHF